VAVARPGDFQQGQTKGENWEIHGNHPYPLLMTVRHGIDGPFIDDFPIKTLIHKGFSMAMLNNQMV
jgi:hypothetical protein